MSLEIKIVERKVVKEIKYGGISGNDELSIETYSPTIKNYYFTIDYDLFPVDASYAEVTGNDYIYADGVYKYKFYIDGNYNYNQEFYNALTFTIRDSYYCK